MELDTGEKEGVSMARKGKARPGDEPVGKLMKVADFLPPPNELLPQEETVKITLLIDSATANFFKKVAKKNGTKYQRMMREVLKGYAKKYAS
jgi:hypothetical protein